MAAAKKAPAKSRRAKTTRATTSKPAKRKPASKKSSKNLVKKTPLKKVKPAKKDTLIKTNPLSLPQTVSLSVLNPFRLPIDTDLLAINTARFAGLTFVVLGGFFALLNLQSFDNSLFALQAISNQATVCDPQVDPECDYFATATESPDQLDSISGCELDDNVCLENYYSQTTNEITFNALTNPQPAVNFAIDFKQPLTGTVPIKISVQNADRVKVLAFAVKDQQIYNLGLANRTGGSSWQLDWFTNQYDDGAYKLKAIVSNSAGTYDASDSVYNFVENIPFPETTFDEINSVNSNEGISTTGESDQNETNFSISLLSPTPLRGDAIFKVVSDTPAQFKFRAENTATGEKKLLGYAFRFNSNEWRYKWETQYFTDGSYSISALMIIDGKVESVQKFNSSVQILNNQSILNNQNTSTTTTAVNSVESINSDLLVTEQTTESEPTIDLRVSEQSPLTGEANFVLNTNLQPKFIELYTVSNNAQAQKFLGLFQRFTTGTWRNKVQTINVPNGSYKVFARLKTDQGIFESNRLTVEIFNAVSIPERREDYQIEEEQIAEIKSSESDSLTKIIADAKKTTRSNSELDKQQFNEVTDSSQTSPAIYRDLSSTSFYTAPDTAAGEEPVIANAILESEDVIKRKVAKHLAKFETELADELRRLATALRSGDETSVNQVRLRLDNLQNKIVEFALSEDQTDELSDVVVTRTESLVQKLIVDTERTEKIIKERIGEKIVLDTDQDGVTDFDEVTIYNTDPNSADSDGDGFNDGTEILNGYNPIDAAAEVVIEFESPKETGLIRQDILSVDDIAGLDQDPDDAVADGVAEIAIISGKGLPNSFVTLYIFSTPVIATVKTTSDGSWSYKLDKELEDGEHEIYAGVTDNAGRIVAKSEPLRFVKEAQAFTPADAASAAPVLKVPQSTNLASQNVILIVLSISVVGIGVTLILLGLHLARRRETILSAVPLQTNELA